MKTLLYANRIIWLSIAAALCICWMSCKTAKDNKAFKRVVNDKELAERTFRELEKDRPCANDSIYITQSDTIISYDTAIVFGETVRYDVDSIYIPGQTKVITKTVRIKDTARIYITDNRRLNIAVDSVNWYKGVVMGLKGSLAMQKEETKAQKKRGNKWFIWFVAACILGAGSHVLRSKFV